MPPTTKTPWLQIFLLTGPGNLPETADANIEYVVVPDDTARLASVVSSRYAAFKSTTTLLIYSVENIARCERERT